MPVSVLLALPQPQSPWAALAGRLEALGARTALFGPGEALPAGPAPDVLVTLPWVSEPLPFDRLDVSAWEAEMESGVTGRFSVAQDVALRAADRGCAMVHVLDAGGLFGGAGASAEIAALTAAGLSRAIALDAAGDGIRSNCVAARPDDVETLAVLVLYLAGASVNGQVIALRGSDIHLLGQPRPLRVVHREGGWDEIALAGATRAWSSALASPRETVSEVL